MSKYKGDLSSALGLQGLESGKTKMDAESNAPPYWGAPNNNKNKCRKRFKEQDKVHRKAPKRKRRT
jgi:hypothetical protein